jgi:hypothetical protein
MTIDDFENQYQDKFYVSCSCARGMFGVAVVTSLIRTCSGLGFAVGPMVVGLVA